MASPSAARRFLAAVKTGAAAAVLGAGGTLAFANGEGTPVLEKWQLLDRYCKECHNAADWAGGVAFDTLFTSDIPQDAEVWENTLRKLEGRLMPPPGKPQPPEDERHAFIATLEGTLDSAAAARGRTPGHVALRRLNRTEYASQVEALLGLKIDAAEILPPDAESEGFTNIANVLSVSPTFLDQYLAAARDISVLAVGDPRSAATQAFYTVPLEVNHGRRVAGAPLGTRGGLSVEHHFPASGRYTFNVRISSKGGSLLRSYPTGWLEYRHKLVVFLDGKPVFERDLGGEEDLRAVDQRQTAAVTEIQDRFRDIEIVAEGGPRRLSAAFVARSAAESDDLLGPLVPGQGQDDVPIITGLEIVGPYEPTGPGDTLSRRRIFSCYPNARSEDRACAETIVKRLATQAFRRPAAEADVQKLMGFYDRGAEAGGFEVGVQKAIMATLASTHFLYRVENTPAGLAPEQVHELTGLEIASRLSFFLWSQGPDQALLEAASNGGLENPATLRKQIHRMLKDARARSLITNFAMQWLSIGDIAAVDPDSRIFPEFDEDLRRAFVTELELFVGSVLLEDRPVTDLLTAGHSFLNERLARHYGVRNVTGERFQRVTLADERRWGLLGKGGVLMQTSYPNRTSPVLRGAWILEALIGAPPAAPPPGVETDLDSSVAASASLTVRKRLEQHRAEASCNQCHGVIDPLGLALENFDAIGGWRDLDRDARDRIDAAGQLAGGKPVTGPVDLRNALASDSRRFVTTLTEKLMTYSLGRQIEHFDMPTVRRIVREAEQGGYKLSSIIEGIVESDAFRLRAVPAAESNAQHVAQGARQ